MIIAMDGPAGSGKSTLAVLVAKKLGIHFFNSGMIYRAIGYALRDVDYDDFDTIRQFLSTAKIDVAFDGDKQKVFVNGEDVTPYVTLKEIGNKASLFSQVPEIRQKVDEIQHEFAKVNDFVVEGRDTTTVVFPNADYKFFITASVDVRAKRRLETLLQQGEEGDLEQIKSLIIQRDENDTNRQISPLKIADGATVIDTSNDTQEESLNKILSCIRG